MKIAPSLALIAVGAIFTFAINSSPSWLNLQIVGVVLMATGVAALFLSRRAQGWLRRRMVVRRGPRGPVVTQVDETLPPYIMLNPGAVADGSEQPGIPLERTVIVPASPDVPPADLMADQRVTADNSQASGTEILDEYTEE
jgi:hypothetical protein